MWTPTESRLNNSHSSPLTAHLRTRFYAGLHLKIRSRDKTTREIELGLDQDGLFRWEMLWCLSCTWKEFLEAISSPLYCFSDHSC